MPSPDSASASSSLVSVVLPTYKRPDFLDRAIASIFEQTHRHWELIVVDDNNELDEYRLDTQAFMQRFAGDARVRYVQHSRNLGGAAARNTGISDARGDFVAFLDDDDEWHPGKLQAQLEAFDRAGPNVGVVYSGIEAIDASTGTSHVTRPSRQGALYPQILARNHIGSTSCLLCRRNLLFQIGLFDESLAAAQDYDLFIRLARVSDFAHVDRVLVRRHKHAGERITQNFRAKIAAFEAIHRKHQRVLQTHPRILSSFLFIKARLHMAAGDHTGAARAFAAAYRLNPTRVALLAYWFFASVGVSGYDAARLSTRPIRLWVHRLIHENR